VYIEFEKVVNSLEARSPFFWRDVDSFFSNDSQRILFILENRKLVGIISNIDYNKCRELHNCVNRNYKSILHVDNEVDKRQAEAIFSRYKNIAEIPVVYEDGTICYIAVRKGEASDVYPLRFWDLYGENSGLANYILRNYSDILRVRTESRDQFENYIQKYLSNQYLHIEMITQDEEDAIDIERLLIN